MKVLKVDLKNDFLEAIKEAIAVLKLGGAIVYPTDTLYALGANALDPYAVERVFKIKQRPKARPLPIAVRNIKWAKELAYIGQKEEKILKAVWPGAVSVVLQKKPVVPDILTSGQRNVAMRIPKHEFVDKLLGRFGYPITSTSANISGEESSRKITEIISVFEKADHKPDLIVDAGDLAESEPSTILDLTTDKPKILRVGPVKPEKLMKLLEL